MYHGRLGVGEQKVVRSLLPPALSQTQAAHIPVDLLGTCSLFFVTSLQELVIELLCSDVSEAVCHGLWD